MTDRRELAGGILFFGAIIAALVLNATGVMYGWGVFAVFAAFCVGLMLIFND